MNDLSALATTTPSASAPKAAPPRIAGDAVTVITPADRAVSPCTSVIGLLREACVDEGDVWMGMVSSEPGTASVWHDHGDRTTYLLPLEGEAVVEFGDEGRERMVLVPDGSVYVIPPHLRHREVNTGGGKMQAFLVRLGPKAVGATL